LKEVQGSPVIGLRSYPRVKAGNGFDVVVEDVGRGGEDYVQGRGIFPKVRNQQFYESFGSLFLDGTDGFGKVVRSAILQVIPGDRRDDYIA